MYVYEGFELPILRPIRFLSLSDVDCFTSFLAGNYQHLKKIEPILPTLVISLSKSRLQLRIFGDHLRQALLAIGENGFGKLRDSLGYSVANDLFQLGLRYSRLLGFQGLPLDHLLNCFVNFIHSPFSTSHNIPTAQQLKNTPAAA